MCQINNKTFCFAQLPSIRQFDWWWIEKKWAFMIVEVFWSTYLNNPLGLIHIADEVYCDYPLLLFCITEAASDAQACSRSTLCCRLGRKAVRLSYPAMYTCKIEALAQGLEYHTSASHRLKLMPPKTDQADRMDAANTLHMSFGFRKRLMLCESKGRVQKQCFEYCCERKLREEQAKARRINHRQDRQDPS